MTIFYFPWFNVSLMDFTVFRERVRLCLRPVVYTAVLSLDQLGLTPTTVSFLVLLLTVPVGLLFMAGNILWIPVLFLALGFDGVDGALASHQGSMSRRGDFLDWLIDRLSCVWIIYCTSIGFGLGFAVYLAATHVYSSSLGKILYYRGIEKVSTYGFRFFLVFVGVASLASGFNYIPYYLVACQVFNTFLAIKLSLQAIRDLRV